MKKLFIAIASVIVIACNPVDVGEDPIIQTQEGFQVEQIYHPGSEGQGSWVSITTDDKGRFIACDQYGHLYRFTAPSPGNKLSKSDIEEMDIQLGHAQGLLWAFNSLYVSVNSNDGIDGRNSGFYRVTDTDGDDKLDHIETLQELEGAGEHGPHAIRLSPDGESLYFIAGNHTLIPDHFSSRLPKNWNTDNILQPFPDARGHAAHIKPPGGWIVKTDPEGKEWELISTGYRNPYDMDFNEAGELFVFDSDMEWDLGTPWYRPIRVCHAVSGSEFGWRTGTGKWPAYYPDNLPPVVNIGQGSPTGVLMGRGAAFPAKYQQGLYIFDWSFGTMYMINLSADGASYTGEIEEFLSGIPLPLADGVIGDDGAMYFVSGGRRLDSRLFRVTYTGTEGTEPAPASTETGKELRAIRHQLEAFHNKQDPTAVETAWEYLDHEDQFIRYAARIAIEHQPVESWQQKALVEKSPQKLLHATLALARQGASNLQDAALGALNQLNIEDMSEEDQLNLFRVYQLLIIRMGEPAPQQRITLANRLEPLYPSGSYALNRELCQLLTYLKSPHVIEKTLTLIEQGESEADPHSTLISTDIAGRDLERYNYGEVINQMSENHPPTQEMFYIKTLSYLDEGWTPDQHKRYFQWFYDAMTKSGGASYKGFLEQFRLQAMSHVPEGMREELAEIAGTYELGAVDLASLPQPKGPGKNYNPSDINRFLRDKLEEKRDFENGKAMYKAALCESCHQMKGEGRNIGPDLTQLSTRFSRGDIIHSVISPSASITDQYAATQFELKDGKSIIGRIVEENETEVVINQNPYDPQQTQTIVKDDIASQAISPVSIMPPGLFNRLNEDEVADLIAYLMAGGDENHELFQ